ncbi:MAG: glycosyltransferase family 1 protein [Phycisphaerales bacterium]|nr:glycosyltransferase family 1 protein [Phycisphaerales bacterium]
MIPLPGTRQNPGCPEKTIGTLSTPSPDPAAKAAQSFGEAHLTSKRPPSRIRVCLFTDTLGDVNGVSRFIRTIAEKSLAHPQLGLDLLVLTSTRFQCPDAPNVRNHRPRFSRPMPGYSTLDIVWPDSAAMIRDAERFAPDVVHVSTPGPVGRVGRAFARRHGLPLIGTYHTDFPAYIDHLFDDAALTWICRAAMRSFYAPFAKVLTRSADYAAALERIGVGRDRIVRLIPGIDTDTFHIRHRDPSGTIWRGIPNVRPTSIKALSVGRVSVEKNLPALATLWPIVARQAQQRGIDTQLIIIGDGPYRARMEHALAQAAPPGSFLFAGFRFGQELSTIYASSDLFLFPSTTDTLGQVVMEAQCSGLPVIVTDQGGPKEVVDDGRTGYVLPDPSRADGRSRWIDAIMRLLTNNDLRQSMGSAGHALIAPMSIIKSVAQFREVHSIRGLGASPGTPGM